MSARASINNAQYTTYTTKSGLPFPGTSTGITAVAAVTSYGFSSGDWYCWGGFGAPDNTGSFQPNRSRKIADYTDGTSNTLMATDVKVYQPLLRPTTIIEVSFPNNIPPATISPASISEYASTTKVSMAHTFWADGNAHETAMTTAWPPNTTIKTNACLGVAPPVATSPGGDCDMETALYVSGGPTYAALTARSYHPGGINAAFGDGSVKFIKNTVNGNTWRALGSVQGGEVISADAY